MKTISVREFSEMLADKYYGDCEKDIGSEIDFLINDGNNLSVDEETVWFCAQEINIFGCEYLCIGKWGGGSALEISSPDNNWYIGSDGRNEYIESIIESLMILDERGNHKNGDMEKFVDDVTIILI